MRSSLTPDHYHTLLYTLHYNIMVSESLDTIVCRIPHGENLFLNVHLILAIAQVGQSVSPLTYSHLITKDS